MKGEERFDSTTKNELTCVLAEKGVMKRKRGHKEKQDWMQPQSKIVLVQRARTKQTPKDEKATCNDQA